MKSTDMLNKVKEILGVELSEEKEIKLAQAELENGTIIESESFEPGNEIFIVTEDERVPLPIGDYKLIDGETLIIKEEGIISSIGAVEEEPTEEVEAEDFGMVEDFGLQMEYSDEDLLPENTAPSSINVGFVGVGGGGNKMANAFIELGFNKTLLVNSTGKDIPKNVEEDHVVLIPDSDGIGKNVEYGKEVLSQNGAIVEDALRIKLGKIDWLFVLAGGGGGTGSSVTALPS